MDNIQEIKAKIQQPLEQEEFFNNKLRELLDHFVGNDPRAHSAAMIYIQMIRCFGQFDGISSLLIHNGDIPKVLNYIDAELSELVDRMNKISQN